MEQASALISLGVRKFESVKRAANRNELEVVAHGKRGKNIIMPFDNGENRRTFETCYQHCEKRLNPLAYWHDAYIWDYSKEAKLEQCSLYSEGFTRLGCIGCPQARRSGRERDFVRWAGFKQIYLHSFEKVIAIRKARGLLAIGHFETAQELFDWWISDKAQDSLDENQIELLGWNN